MLSIIAAPALRPEVETIDRDPGIISFLTALARVVRAGASSLRGHIRMAHQRANEAALFSSSSAWPHNHRIR